MSEAIPNAPIFAIGGDPGGASALAPVVEALRARGHTVEARAYRHATQVWERRGLDSSPWPESLPPVLPPETALLLTSTSLNGLDLEKHFVAAANARGIPSLTVLDYWSKYRERFSLADEALDALPEIVAVMDEQAYAEMIAADVAADRLVITGQPAFDELAQWRSQFTEQRRNEVRREFGVGVGDALVVFVSQPFAKFRGQDASEPDFMGYDEHSVVALLVAALEKAAEESGRAITLLVRPHPRENPEDFAALRSTHVSIQVSTAGDAREVVCSADLVVGMNTVLLVEACHLGCIVVSLQPNTRGLDPLPTNREGISRAVYTEAEVPAVIANYLFDSETRAQALSRLARLPAAGHAAEAVADLAESLLRRSSLLSHP